MSAQAQNVRPRSPVPRSRSPVPRRSSPTPRHRPGTDERWHHDGEAADAAEAIARKEKAEAEQREEQRLAREQRHLEEAEQKRHAQRQRRAELEEQARKAELQRIAEKAEAQRQAEAKRVARQAKIAEQQRLEAEERRLALEKRLAAEREAAEEKQEQARLEREALSRTRSLQARLSGQGRQRGVASPPRTTHSRSPASSSETARRRSRKRRRREAVHGASSQELSRSPTRCSANLSESLSCICCGLIFLGSHLYNIRTSFQIDVWYWFQRSRPKQIKDCHTWHTRKDIVCRCFKAQALTTTLTVQSFEYSWPPACAIAWFQDLWLPIRGSWHSCPSVSVGPRQTGSAGARCLHSLAGVTTYHISISVQYFFLSQETVSRYGDCHNFHWHCRMFRQLELRLVGFAGCDQTATPRLTLSLSAKAAAAPLSAGR